MRITFRNLSLPTKKRNAILSDDGVSGLGSKQNALIRVDSESRTATYTPEYYAVKHYTHFVSPGSKIVAFKNNKEDKTPVLVVVNPEGKYIILVGNFNDESKNITFPLIVPLPSLYAGAICLLKLRLSF